jgi:hypothetical protein
MITINNHNGVGVLDFGGISIHLLLGHFNGPSSSPRRKKIIQA